MKIKTFCVNEIFAEPPQMKYVIIRFHVYHIKETWIGDLLELNECGPTNNKKAFFRNKE